MTEIKFENGKYVGIVNGKVVVRSTSEYYVKRKVESVAVATESRQAATVSEFTINERFGFVEQMVDMIAKKTLPSCIITGEGGLGKTYTVLKSLKEAGLKNITDLGGFEVGTKVNISKSFRVIKGFSTAKGLYRTLFEGNGMTLVFDDCDSVLKDPVALNLLKSALDSYGERYLSWNADMRDDDLPKTFTFTGSIIFISNMPMDRIDQAVRTRALCVDLSMSESQKLERMQVIAQSDEFLPEISKTAKEQALDFLNSNIGKVPNMSLRTLIAVAKITAKGGNWKPLAKYVLTQGA